MEIQKFLANPVVQQSAYQLVANNNSANRGYIGARIFPETLSRQNFIQRKVQRFSTGGFVADTVAPLSRGTQKGLRVERTEIIATMVDAHVPFALDGEELEDWMEVVGSITGTNVAADHPAVLAFLGMTENFLIDPLDQQIERMRWNLLATGKLWPAGSADNSFVKPAVDYGFAGTQLVTNTIAAGTSIFGGVDYNLFDQFRKVKAEMLERGYDVAVVYINQRTADAVIGRLEVRNELAGQFVLSAQNGTGTLQTYTPENNVTLGALNAKLQSLELPVIEVYNKEWRDQVRIAGDPSGAPTQIVRKKFIRDGEMIFTGRPNEDKLALIQLIGGTLDVPLDPSRVLGITGFGRMTARVAAGRYVGQLKYIDEQPPHLRTEAGHTAIPFLNEPMAVTVVRNEVP